MSSVSSPGPATASAAGDEDRTARARIRDVALRLFGTDGFRAATVRAIAEAADVSPALVVHHFGSKEGLRAAVDEHVADFVRAGKLAAMTGGWTISADEYEQMVATHAPYLRYVGRALSDNSAAGQRLYDRMHADAVEYLAAGEEAGVVRGGDDPAARAAFLLNASLSLLVLAPHAMRVLGLAEPGQVWPRLAGPILDIYTDGLFTDDRFRRGLSSDGDRDEGHDTATSTSDTRKDGR